LGKRLRWKRQAAAAIVCAKESTMIVFTVLTALFLIGITSLILRHRS
jgi:hypothetical protein